MINMVCWKAVKFITTRKFYIPSIVITTLFLFSLLAILQEYLFLNPFTFYIPTGELLTFSLIVLISILAGLTVPIAIYKIFKYSFTIRDSKEFLAIIFGLGAGCGCSIALSIITVFGLLGSSLIGFLNLYQTPIRILAIILLSYSFYSEMNFLGKLHCR